HRRPADRDRQDQDARPQRQRPRRGQEAGQGDGAVDGHSRRVGGAVPPKGKKYVDATQRFDRQRLFGPAEALDLARSLASATFDETVELAVRLGVDPRKADQIVRGTVALPAGTGKAVRVAVFAAGEAANQAREAGADI